jgi:hypothetical protein
MDLTTGDVVRIYHPGNMHHEARCVYLGPWTNREGFTYYGVVHMHGSPTKSESGRFWYTKGQETHWNENDLQPTGEKACFCADCDQWFVGEGYLCYFCKDNQ